MIWVDGNDKRLNDNECLTSYVLAENVERPRNMGMASLEKIVTLYPDMVKKGSQP